MKKPCGRQFVGRGRAGMTLVEVMISVGLSVMVIGAIVSAMTSITENTLSAADEADLNVRSRTFVNQFGIDARACSEISGASATGVALVIPGSSGDTTVTYAYDPGTARLTRTVGGVSRVLLTDLTAFEFRFLEDATTETIYPDEVRILEAQFSVRKTSLLRRAAAETTINTRYFRRLTANFDSL